MLLMKKALVTVAVCLSLAVPQAMAADMPGKGVTVKPARATWNTGFFSGSAGKKGTHGAGLRRKGSERSSESYFL
jgi:glycine betaine/proline transport system substrate-binding protein